MNASLTPAQKAARTRKENREAAELAAELAFRASRPKYDHAAYCRAAAAYSAK